MSKLTVTIPDDLHQKIREELERQGITTSQFIEQAITTFFEKPKGVSNTHIGISGIRGTSPAHQNLSCKVRANLSPQTEPERVSGTSH